MLRINFSAAHLTQREPRITVSERPLKGELGDLFSVLKTSQEPKLRAK